MIEFFRQLLGIKPVIDFEYLVNAGAVLLDVRNFEEYQEGHIRGAINVPIDKLKTDVSAIPNKQQPIIACCSNGTRSAVATSLLIANGYQYVYNGGRWLSLQRKLNRKGGRIALSE